MGMGTQALMNSAMSAGAGIRKKRQPSKRNLLIKELMAHHGCTLAEASKHIKASGMNY